jgi:hypothetical protein
MKTPLLMGCLAIAIQVPGAHAQSSLPPAAAQVAAAISALPEEFKEQATVLGYGEGKSALVPLRKGAGPYVCLADDPSDERFHVACYHKSLEDFMARGRALRAQKVANVDSVRFAEIDQGKLKMPAQPAALYSLTGTPENVTAATGVVTGARPLYVVYIPFATPESTGLPAKAEPNQPWIMFPGTAKAHIMFVPRMSQ